MFKLLVSFLFFGLVNSYTYNNNTIEFIDVFENRGYKFSTVDINNMLNISQNPYVIDHEHYWINDTKYEGCFQKCANNNLCVGVYTYRNVDTNMNCCFELNDIGRVVETNETGFSYLKIDKRNYHDDDLYDINVFVLTSNNTNREENMTIYLDINHNGELDEGEVFVTKTYEEYYTITDDDDNIDNSGINFKFKNLKEESI